MSKETKSLNSNNKTSKKVVKKNSKIASKSAPKSKNSTKNVIAKKEAKTKTTKKPSEKKDVLEYYDLPYTYNKTFVRILAQTPNTLFVYWEVSEDDRKLFYDKFGQYFFTNTKPILIVHNKTKNYKFEIEINDFANSWYFNVADAKCDYEIELGRKKISTSIPTSNDYFYIASSNKIENPNDHILFEQEQKIVFFKNTKTNHTFPKDVANLQFIKHLGNTHRIYDFYNKVYKNEELKAIENPSSFSNF